MTDYKHIKLLQIIDECNRHVHQMINAYKKMLSFMPLDADSYAAIKDDDIEHIDQFIFRFSKLQDAMGEKLFSAILSLIDENIKSKTFIDILNRLEELNLLEVDEWRLLGELRNQIAHEYSTRSTEIVKSINMLYDRTRVLYDIFVCTKNFALDKILNIKDIGDQYIIATDHFPNS